MPWRGPQYPGDFPSLGYLVGDWIEAHCVIPDRDQVGEPFILTDEQLRFEVHHYRLREHAKAGQLAPAFFYRRSQLVRPQKWGKNPLIAAMICAEGVGPVLFAGWARGGEVYDCLDYGCHCGWVYVYERGEPMGRPWATPLIQITATSEEQTDNTYDALRPMIDLGPLHELIPKTGEEFIRLPAGGRIDVVTANARSRLGQRVTFVPQDETGIWTPTTGMVKVAETQRRGLAGMGGRAVETTNAWDPSEDSVAQRTYESRAQDLYRDYPQSPATLSYRNKAERRKIHKFNYAGSWWVDLDGIEAEAAELLEKDPGQAERFFGNRVVAGVDAWMDPQLWDRCRLPGQTIADGELITAGFDGSQYDDATVLRACRLSDGYLFTPTFGPDHRPAIWEKPEGERGRGWEVPRGQVDVAVNELFSRFRVIRLYADPPYWQSEVDGWYSEYGDAVFRWETKRDRQMSEALEQLHTDVVNGEVIHDADPVIAQHIGNARRDIRRGGAVCIKKDRPQSPRKIDGAMATTLAYKARFDAIREGYEIDEEPAELVSW